MNEIIPLILGGLAILAALLAVPGFALARWSLVFAALAGGQVYIAVIAFAVLLVVENGFKIRFTLPSHVYVFLGFSFVAIVGLTLLSPVSFRTLSELVQLALYLFLFTLLTSFLQTGREVMLVFRAATIGSVGAAFISFALNALGFSSGIDVFIGRGANEGATFMSLIGVVSSVVMFARTRNPVYIVAALFLTYMQYLATSRGSMAVSGIVILIGLFFQFRNPLLRAGMAFAGLVILVRNVPILRNLAEGQVNFSARERLALLEHGWDLSWERFWTGHGWGSTDTLAAAAPTTRNIYLHFHNTYIQMIAEMGLFGWVLLGAFLYFVISAASAALFRIKQPAVSTLVFSGFLAILIAANFEALLFGADRSVQVVILCSLIARAIAIGKTQSSKPEQARISESQRAELRQLTGTRAAAE